MMSATALWAALHAPLFLWLSMRIVPLRHAARVTLGTGGDAALERAVRAQANFAEYAPFALLLLALSEAGGAPGWVLHPLGAVLLAGRGVHAWGITRLAEDIRLRAAGMIATFAVIALAAVAALVASAGGWR
ncbi:MAPEG family protein [Roseomonas sp. HJA6]|uniref:MAPEG family protein n=1 Tax=Roseomonas alba TaxID=2846776 RepID=A0ABS7AD61_9PROT|nr:MAPEG family protein [Neoroseomonas alba]MBW6400240.1 MAPEG family protein [Neoroseomonas alba]